MSRVDRMGTECSAVSPALPAIGKAPDWATDPITPTMKIRSLGVVSAAICLAFVVLRVPSLRAAEAELAQLRTKAEKGNVLAQYNLGLAYAEGRDTPRDLIEAYVWLRLASDNGGTGTALSGVIRQMSIEEIATARIRLEELRRNLAAAAAEPPPAAPAVAPTRPPVAAQPAPAEDRVAAMQVELSKLRADNARLTQELASMQEKQAGPEVSGAPADKRKLADLGAELEAVRKELEKAKAGQVEFAAKSEELVKLRSDNEVLAAANRRLEEQGRAAADLPRKLAEAQSALEQLKAQNGSLQAQGAEGAAPSGGAEELVKLKEQLGRANSEVQMTLRSYELLRQENERLIAQITQAKTP